MEQVFSNGGQGRSCKKSCVGMLGRGVWEHDLWCPDEDHLEEAGTYGANAFKEAIINITSTAIVPSGIDITYRGGNQVRLLPGFHAAQGSAFHAFIHPCDRAGNSFKSMPSGGAPSAPEDDATKALQPTLLTVQPNPNQGNFTVRLPEGSTAAIEIRLLNAQGRTVPINWRPTSPALEISLADHTPAGLYLLQVLLTDGTLHHAKIILQP